MAGEEYKLRAVVGLGNPGEEYAGTRHNLGTLLVEGLLGQARSKQEKRRKHYLLGVVTLERRKLLLMRPRCYVNQSGGAVLSLLAAEKLRPEEVLVACDDVALPLGGLRLRRSGGSGGHRGLESIIDRIGGEFPRLRMGVGAATGDMGDLRLQPGWRFGDHLHSADHRTRAELAGLQPNHQDPPGILEPGDPRLGTRRHGHSGWVWRLGGDDRHALFQL